MPSSAQLVIQSHEGPLTESADAVDQSSAVKLIYQAKDEIKLENLAVRSNGHLILTDVREPKVYELDPDSFLPSMKLLYTFPNATGMTGIVETTPDVFVVVAGIWNSTTFTAIPGSFFVWSIDFNSFKPTVKMITAMPGAAALNGMTNLDGSPNIVLIADSVLGTVWRLDTVTGEHSVAIQSPLFTGSVYFHLGINGLASHGKMLHFTNSAQRMYGRVPLSENGSASDELQILNRPGLGCLAYDDLAIDWEGNAWVASHPNALTEVTVEGRNRNVTAMKNAAQIKFPTSAAFGRGSKREEKIVYVTASGDGKTSWGQVFAIDTCMI